ncbi:MAG: hypothetical protein K0R84_1772, partial [Clostridia bacterium]|nr:hypothetical protein [Clostridia bacterium]
MYCGIIKEVKFTSGGNIMRNTLKHTVGFVVAALIVVNSVMLYSVTRQNNQLKQQLSRIDMEVRQTSATVSSLQNNSRNNQSNQVIMKTAKDVMTPMELAEYLGIKMDKVYDLVDNKDAKIPYINIDGEYKFS